MNNLDTLKQLQNLQNDVVALKLDVMAQASGSGADYSTEIEQLEKKVTNLQKVTDNFMSMLKDRNKATDSTYSPIDKKAVYQTYDWCDRYYDFSGTSEFSSGVFYFAVKDDCVAHLKITLLVCGQNSGTGQLKLFVNQLDSAQVDTHSFDFYSTNTPIELYFDINALSNGNYMHFKLQSTNSESINFSYAKLEVYDCDNPIVLSKRRPFEVLYADGNYYLADCSQKQTKLATISVDDLSVTSDINWQTMEFEARELAYTPKIVSSSSLLSLDYVNYAYINKKNQTIFVDTALNNSVSSTNSDVVKINSLMLNSSYYSTYTASVYKYATKEYLQAQYYSANGTNYYREALIYSTDYAYTIGLKLFCKQIAFPSYSVFGRQLTNGSIYICISSIPFFVGFGRLLELYALDTTFSTLYMIVEQYGKILQYKLNILSNKLDSTEIVVLGNYDYYFPGIDNDYFVIKNNKLYYYKDYLQALN